MHVARNTAFRVCLMAASLFSCAGSLELAGARVAVAAEIPLIPKDAPSAVIDVTRTGRNLAKLRFNGIDTVVALPANDANPGTTMSVAGTVGEQPGVDFKETLSLRFNHDVTFTGYPAFRLGIPREIGVDKAFELQFIDGTASLPLRQVAVNNVKTATFLGGYFTPFHARAGHTYQARLIPRPPAVVTLAPAKNQQSLALPVASGVVGSVDLPATASSTASITVTASEKPPVGIPEFTGLDGIAMPYYVDVAVRNGVSASASITATLVLPLTSTFSSLEYNLALYDAASPNGWRPSLFERATRQGDVLRFTVPPLQQHRFQASGRYVFALIAAQPDPTRQGLDRALPTTSGAAPRGPVMAILGDSVSILTVLPQNPIGCEASNGPLGCQYTGDPTLNYPGVVAQLTGAKVSNFSSMNGSQTTVDTTANNVVVKSWLSSQVPQISDATDVVVFEGGIADSNTGDPKSSSRVALMADAIRARAPRAKIIFVGPRCCGKVADAWNDAERDLAARYGAYVDLRSFAPPGVSAQFPDGIHASPETHREIGAAIAKAISSL